MDYADKCRMVREEKAIVIDMDDTICVTDKDVPYSEREPKWDVILMLRDYSKRGFYIIIDTGRQMRTHNCNIGKINAETLPILIEWLRIYDVPYDEIRVGRPWCGKKGFYVCDSTVTPIEFVTLTYEQIQEKLKKGRGN